MLPADFSYRNLDLVLDSATRGVRRLRRALRPLSAEYELVVIDCAPSISLVSESVFDAADAFLVLLIPTTLSARLLASTLGRPRCEIELLADSIDCCLRSEDEDRIHGRASVSSL